jgi:hypothetical protein
MHFIRHLQYFTPYDVQCIDKQIGCSMLEMSHFSSAEFHFQVTGRSPVAMMVIIMMAVVDVFWLTN